MGKVLMQLLLYLLLTWPDQVVRAQQHTELNIQHGHFQRLLIFLEDRRGSQPTAEDYVQLIEKVMTGFSAASELLQNLTAGVGRPLRIGSASILVSARLGRQLSAAGMTVGQAQWQRRNRADFVVSHDVDASTEGCVAMEIGCGKPGKKVVMLDSSFTNDTRRIVDRKIALFFSQYRWGLLSEQPIGSPIETGPDGELRVSACSAELRVHLADENGRSTCEFDLNSRQTSQGCAPRLSDSQPDGPLASFMFAPFHRDVSRFCDSQSRDPRLQHNRLVDSLMNRQCDGLSAAEVIRLHRDYWGTPAGTQPAPGDVVFDVVAEKSHRRVVVVMDVSGSMSGIRISMMRSAVSQFLIEIIEDGSECALISFTSQYQVLSNFVKIQSRWDRERLSNIVGSLVANGGTCIGGAVTAAASLLGAHVHSSANAYITGQIILLSDGIEGCASKLDNAIRVVAQSSIEVVSIRYGDAADPRMDRLAEVTGGKKFFGGTTVADSSGLRLVLGATNTEVDESKRTLTLTSEEIGSRLVRRKFYVDDSMKRDLVFRIVVPSNPSAVAQLRVLLTAPAGQVFGYNNHSSIYEANAAVGTIAIRVPDMYIQAGDWILKNDGSDSKPENQQSAADGGSIVVTGRPSDDSVEAPVVLSAEVYPTKVENIVEETKIAVYSRLLKGHSAVLNGTLYATVRSDSNLVAKIDLMDNGAGADLKARDGTYSGYLPIAQLNEARDFSVSVTSVSPVSRVTSAGKLTVQKINPTFNRQLVSPAKVIDLRVLVDAMSESAVLQWTAVEDPTVKNSSARYEIRYGRSYEQLIKNFSTCPVLAALTDHLGPPGSKIQMNVFSRLLDRGTVFLSVLSVSALNVSGPQSNVVVVDLSPPSVSELEHIGLLPIERMQKPSYVLNLPLFMVGLTIALAAVSSLAYVSTLLYRSWVSYPEVSSTEAGETLKKVPANPADDGISFADEIQPKISELL